MKYILSFGLILFLVSCQSNTKDKQGLEKSEKIEENVLALMKKIEHANQNSLRKLLVEFVAFSDKVSGDTKSTYSGFAFNYPQDNPKRFFSALRQGDEKIIDKWVVASKDELLLVLKNVENSRKFYRHFKKDFKKKLSKLNKKEQDLGMYYLKKLDAVK